MKESNHFRKEEEISALDSRNRPRWCHGSTLRAQYAKHNPPLHAKPWGRPAEHAMKAEGL